jgi:hypothetical protein
MKKQSTVRIWFEQPGILSPTDRKRVESDLLVSRVRAEQAAGKGDEKAFAEHCAQIEALEKKLGQ